LKSSYIKTFSIFIIIALGFLVYSNTFFSSFHFDDDLYIINDYAIRNIQNLFAIWKICPCRFIAFLSLAINYHFNHLDVLGYHILNLLIHLGTACFVWWLVLMTFASPVMKDEKITKHANSISLFAALIFVSHPVQVEAVTYIWQRTASMAAFFYIASLSFYVKSRLLKNPPLSYKEGPGELKTQQSFYYISSLIFAGLAMFTKENTITLPLMILLYEFSFLNIKKEINWNYLFPFMMTIFIIPETMFLTGSTRFQEIQSIVGGHEGITSFHYLLTQFRVMITYIRLLFLPIHLNLDYDYPIYKSIFRMPVLASFLSLATILYFAKRMFSKYRLISFSIFWFFITLLPESSILPQEDVIFEHRLYLPLVGFCILLVSSIYYLFERKTRLVFVILSLMVLFNSFLTYQRNKTWKNEIFLWSDVLQKSPHKARAYNNLGWAYYNQGSFDQAMSNFNKALEINPEYIFSYDDRGLIYSKEGRFTEAVAEYDKAIKINPYYAMIYDNRGQAFLKQGHYAQAISDFDRAIKLDPENGDAYNARAQALFLDSRKNK